MFRGVDFYNVDELLSDEDRLVRQSVREFLEKEVVPLVADAWHEEKPLNFHELGKKFGELGMLGTFLPEEYGCPGMTYTTFGVVCQEVERVDSALRSFVAVTSGLVMYPIWRYGSEEQKREYLPKLARGEIIGAFGLTEPNHGSDPGSMEATARRDGDEWVLNGTKTWISEADVADIAVVWARDVEDGKIKGFIVERGTKGFQQTAITKKASMRAGSVGELGLVNCRVPEENRLPEARGLGAPLSCLNQARFGISWGAIGAAMDCYETALNYTKERKQFGAPLASYQLVQEKLVNMLIEITKGQLLAWRLAKLMDEGKATTEQISMAKKNNVRVARYCARTARELLGANGISLDYSPIRHMANIESVYTYEGTDDIHTLILGRAITGYQAFRRELR
ncbi:acyl-CoA dehydrogenase [Archaeoglobus fulgidus]|uniref:Acyl-CoA dehydrogenase n=2 Tax=Archaeoglobus fulgidus TaxID=2234 RepID=A0A075WJU9_ARCFL|nr:acyl-CoA dehydrogenase [Archaeoglobus fulgidus]AIG97868.1 Acyl-CoA dehydrogenase [Archaeoglobus fulgidus DSM 8774]KUJ92757.1 MAG: Glutaryl-CoA dehydrogenase (GcdH) [Archaeoglobus fulgidus]KUK05441.1 MAG: Glutaryl-CoA dehydrogenase (GcdH) [Archaeoglobus fulgidus]